MKGSGHLQTPSTIASRIFLADNFLFLESSVTSPELICNPNKSKLKKVFELGNI